MLASPDQTSAHSLTWRRRRHRAARARFPSGNGVLSDSLHTPCVSLKAAVDDVARHRLKRLKELVRVVTVLMGIVFNTCPSLKPPVSLGTQLFDLRLM